MFRRSWEALPKDPHFEPDLKKLGYFVNEDDELRNIENPKFYFKYFINKNERYNERQRYALHEALAQEIHDRFAKTGLIQHRLPLEAGPTDPHVPIFASANLATCSRAIIIVGESHQDLGVFAYRTVCGPGGITAGTALSYAARLPADAGLVIANPGQLFWYAEGKRALNAQSQLGVPMPSAVHIGLVTREEHRVPQNRNVDEHVRYMFDTVIPKLLAGNEKAQLHVIGVGDGADAVEAYLDQEMHWAKWEPLLKSLTIMGGLYDGVDSQVSGFRKFLRERARAYIVSDEPLNIPLSGPDGNKREAHFTGFGCPVFSAGEPLNIESIPIKAREAALEWINDVAADADYKNEPVFISYADEEMGNDNVWGPERLVDEALANQVEGGMQNESVSI
ncbi:hypothetical protein MCOR27_010005 [Pyricularia oryzae]|uniref:Arb2 domain-containing protein n=1 Tax=Pyricularia grisea TaxID=148305 RepID=A0ABQ8N7X6_PYRGI|nr:hypothetical protein MCOR01_010019 [Pyricularia oryzae]KAI6292712.1 hypothetical protein MCOR33_009660 [Pyricularia grisea]KAH9436664.1 hypothetical protein MCOR02_000334 [Pyricularia oryzae]KAI6252179.1 hypothetical protein MCOR19_011203 [Pyricularia oryzae]KAI6268798.1 hypothetical protein MCOR27_010005 [Pyricularia oryzae]